MSGYFILSLTESTRLVAKCHAAERNLAGELPADGDWNYGIMVSTDPDRRHARGYVSQLRDIVIWNSFMRIDIVKTVPKEYQLGG